MCYVSLLSLLIKPVRLHDLSARCSTGRLPWPALPCASMADTPVTLHPSCPQGWGTVLARGAGVLQQKHGQARGGAGHPLAKRQGAALLLQGPPGLDRAATQATFPAFHEAESGLHKY